MTNRVNANKMTVNKSAHTLPLYRSRNEEIQCGTMGIIKECNDSKHGPNIDSNSNDLRNEKFRDLKFRWISTMKIDEMMWTENGQNLNGNIPPLQRLDIGPQ